MEEDRVGSGEDAVQGHVVEGIISFDQSSENSFRSFVLSASEMVFYPAGGIPVRVDKRIVMLRMIGGIV